jgi:hypothetical protein
MEVLFWSSTQKKSFSFANQSQFENCNWAAFQKGDKIYSEDGNVIGTFKAKTETRVYLTD